MIKLSTHTLFYKANYKMIFFYEIEYFFVFFYLHILLKRKQLLKKFIIKPFFAIWAYYWYTYYSSNDDFWKKLKNWSSYWKFSLSNLYRKVIYVQVCIQSIYIWTHMNIWTFFPTRHYILYIGKNSILYIHGLNIYLDGDKYTQ